MLSVLPTYDVVARVQEQEIRLKVSEPDLAAFCSILRFNHCASMQYTLIPGVPATSGTITMRYPPNFSHVEI